MTTPNIAAAGDALMASLAPTIPTPLEAELSDKLSAARRRCEALEFENEGRRVAILRVGEERRDEWLRAEAAESERDALKAENERLRSDLALLSERTARLMEATR